MRESDDPLPLPPSLGRLLNVTAGASNRLCQALLARHGLQLAQWVILSALRRRDGQLTSELAGYTGKALPATSRIIDRMIEAHLATRTADREDRRAVPIRLSATGRALEPLAGFWAEINERPLAGSSEAETRTLFALLERVQESARAAARQWCPRGRRERRRLAHQPEQSVAQRLDRGSRSLSARRDRSDQSARVQMPSTPWSSSLSARRLAGMKAGSASVAIEG